MNKNSISLNESHSTDNYLQVPIDCFSLLQFWFGGIEKVTYNGGLWWRGMMHDAKGKNESDRRAYTDQHIAEKWTRTIESDRGLEWSNTTTFGAVAAIVLYDQLPRQAFRGTKKAFATDAKACQIANDLLDKQSHLFLSAADTVCTDGALPWTFQIFVYFALLHSENVQNCERGACGLATLYEIMKVQFSEKAARLVPLLKSAKEHLQALAKFGRYPHRNILFERVSTEQEIQYLKDNHAPWMSSQTPSGVTATLQPKQNLLNSASEKKQKHDGFRVLVLHSNRQSPEQMQRKTRNALARTLPAGSKLIYASAPYKYVAQGEALLNIKHLQASEADSTRCWWNASDDPATMIYSGLEETIAYVNQIAKTNGPFDGIIGFSQGAALAGLLAALVSDKSPLVANLTATLQFCVVISGFFVRDVRPQFNSLTGPNRRESNPIAIPSFHVWGMNDVLVLPERSEALRDSFATEANGVKCVTVTHNLDHFAKAIAVWPVEKIHDWIVENFTPCAAKEESTLIAKLHSVRDLRFDTSAAVKNVDDALAKLLYSAAFARDDVATIDGVFIVMNERKLFNLKGCESNKLAEGLLKIVDTYVGISTAEWKQKVVNILTCFPQVIGAFYVADKETRLFRDGIVETVVASIRRTLETHKCDFIASQLPNKNNRNYEKSGLIADILKPFAKEYGSWYGVLCCAVQKWQDKTDYSGATKRAADIKKGMRNEKDLEKLLALPLSDAVLNPIPQPVDIAHKKEMQQLHDHLRSTTAQNRLEENKEFLRGTLCPDGRLDLCKQVIGPSGVKDLKESLVFDGANAKKVQHLLLGNNIAGAQLAVEVADMIAKKSTAITTWYIAGNHLDGNAIEPVCKALEKDDQVIQLWLKRNPLKQLGAVHIGTMLRANRYLQVLDLTNVGLLDQGTQIVCDDIAANIESALKTLYLESNGITSKSVPSICNMIAKSKLIDLCLGCNRLGDNAAVELAQSLGRLEHLDLSSCGIGSRGALAIASALETNSHLKKLDLGLLKSTNTLGEVPNAIGSTGATALAKALRTNKTLLSLNLLHNGIYQEGVSNLAKALTESNFTLLHLNIEQLGIPSNELTRETIRSTLKRNLNLLSDVEKKIAISFVEREHLAEIKSVYRNEMI